ncbi:hypothetical protein B9T65_06050 [Serratia marcescens]|nr:hypothetical protein AR325_23785 [Serratia marcescens]PHI52330.1 hypothetical protein B9T65_06050 [Serratia marcescens]
MGAGDVQERTERLIFRPASPFSMVSACGYSIPAAASTWGMSGYSKRMMRFYHIGIHIWLMEEMPTHDFYVAWILLPDDISLSEKFESEKQR